MDLNKREEHVEKQEKLHMSLKESFAAMQKKRTEVLTENAKSVGDKLKKSQKIHLKEEDVEDVKDEVKDDVPAVDAPVVDAAPVSDVVAGAPVEGGEVPAVAPVDGAPVTSQDQLATQDFVGTFMKGLPTELDLKASVDANGIFKANVNDEAAGQFVIVAFPAAKNIHQVADLVEPLPPVEGAPMAPAGEMGSVAGSEVPPVVAPAIDAAAMPPVDGAAPVVPPIEGEEEENLQEEKKEVCEEKECIDEEDMCKIEESRKELERDPVISGKKDWKALLESREVNRQKLLKEADEKKK